MVHGRERLGPSATFNKDTPARATSLRKRATIRARRGAGVRVVLMLVETFGGIGPAGRVGVYDETTIHVVGADVDGIHDAAPLGGGGCTTRPRRSEVAEMRRSACRCGGRPASRRSGALSGRLGA